MHGEVAGEVLKNVLIIGGGLAGCTVAKELSSAGIESCIVEKNADIGGKARDYGCKSDAKCNICGLCAIGSLWQDLQKDSKVKKLCNAGVMDVSKADRTYRVLIQTDTAKIEESYTDIVVATGFADPLQTYGAAYNSSAFPRIYTGSGLEKLMRERSADSIFPEVPESVAFIMCYGSRNMKERAAYCSQVCCAYSTRAAKVIKHYYPGIEVVFYYMDLQAVNPGNYEAELAALGIHFVRCRPAGISFEGDYPVVEYEAGEGRKKKKFDYLFLNTGIHPDLMANTALSDLTGLKVSENGFLSYVVPPLEGAVYLAGSALAPMNIMDTISNAKNTALLLIQKEQEGAQ